MVLVRLGSRIENLNKLKVLRLLIGIQRPMNHVRNFIICAILSLLCLGCIAGQADAAPKKKLDLRLKSTSKSESDLLTFNKNQVDDPSTNLGSFFLKIALKML